MEKSPSFVEYGFRRACITLTVFICTLLTVMNLTITNVAYNDICGNLGVSLDEVSWVTTAYILAYIVIIPFSIWLSAKLGNRNYLSIALILFIVSSFLCGNAPGIMELVAFRFLQGLGGGAMLVLSHTIILESWPPQRRTTAQAFFILGILGGSMLAAPFSGYITDNYTWPFIFYTNIPVGILLCILVVTYVKNRPIRQREDWPGTIMLTIGASCLYLALTRGQQQAWFHSLWIIALLLSGLAGLIIFMRREVQWITPQGENGLLRNVNLRNGLILAFVVALGISASAVAITLPARWNVELSRISPWLVMPYIVTVMALVTFLIEEKRALKYMLVAGPMLLIIYNYMIYQQSVGNEHTGYVYYLLPVRILAVILLSVSVSTLTFSKLEDKEIRQVVRMYNLVQLMGVALGVALFSAYTYKPPVSDLARYSAYLDLKDPVVQKALHEGTASFSQVHRESLIVQAHAVQTGAAYVNLFLVVIAGTILLAGIPFVLRRMKNNAKKDNK